jgi:hypothetical protein
MKPWNAVQTSSIPDRDVVPGAVAVSDIGDGSAREAGSEAGAVTNGSLQAKGSASLK